MTCQVGCEVSGHHRCEVYVQWTYVDTSHLAEELDERGVHQTGAPRWNGEHHSPSGGSDGFLSLDCQLDLVELSLDPVFVAAVVVQLFQDH